MVVGEVKSRVVIAADDPRLSYLLLEPVYTVAPNKGVWPPASNKGVRPPELQPLWDEARRQGMELFGALGHGPDELELYWAAGVRGHFQPIARLA